MTTFLELLPFLVTPVGAVLGGFFILQLHERDVRKQAQAKPPAE